MKTWLLHWHTLAHRYRHCQPLLRCTPAGAATIQRCHGAGSIHAGAGMCVRAVGLVRDVAFNAAGSSGILFSGAAVFFTRIPQR